MTTAQAEAAAFARTMAKELVKLLDGHAKDNKDIHVGAVKVFLSCFSKIIVLRALYDTPDGRYTREQLFGFAEAGLVGTKKAIQDAVAHGFQSAMSEFVGRDVEYYCQIKPVPDPLSKTVN